MSIRSLGSMWLVVMALLVASCGTDTGGDTDADTVASTDTVASADTVSGAETDPGLTVVATTTVLGDVIENLVGDDARVEVLTPIGADPHDFQASAAQIALVNEADLVVANGLGLEEGLEDILEAASADGVRVLDVAPLLDPIPFGFEVGHDDHEDEADHDDHEDDADHDDHEDDADHDDHEDDADHDDHEDDADHDDHEDEADHDDHDHDGDDPHVWFDPVRMAEAAKVIAAQLTEIEPGIDWSSRAEEYADALIAADAEIAETLSSIPATNRLLVTNHDSLGYFAQRYGFEVVGVVIPGGSTMGDPSSGELAELIEVMEHEGVGVIFGETTQPSALAEAVAAELGEDVEVVSLYTGSLGEPGSDSDTLIGMLKTNAERIAEALGG